MGRGLLQFWYVIYESLKHTSDKQAHKPPPKSIRHRMYPTISPYQHSHLIIEARMNQITRSRRKKTRHTTRTHVDVHPNSSSRIKTWKKEWM